MTAPPRASRCPRVSSSSGTLGGQEGLVLSHGGGLGGKGPEGRMDTGTCSPPH